MSIWAWLAVLFMIAYVVLGLGTHVWIFRDEWLRETRNVLRKVKAGACAALRGIGLWLLGGLVQLLVWFCVFAIMVMMILVLALGFVMVAVAQVGAALMSVAWWFGLLAKAGRNLVYRFTRKNGKGT